MPDTNGTQNGLAEQPMVVLEMRPERHLIGDGSKRHIDFRIHVAPALAQRPAERRPVSIGLVIDRSGSMHDDKIVTARRAALAVLDKLNDSDRVAAVIFDDRIDVLQNGAPATPEVKARLRAQLGAVEARGSTALHTGWLTGCRAIASDTAGAVLARCFLLTDGLANVGLTDAEQIASEAASVREHAGVGTSTFGIGNDYDESLLGPMAVAGGGQFHNLRTAEEIARTFLGELGELLTVAAANVRLRIDVDPGMGVEMVSPYWAQQVSGTQWTIALGDLLNDEERHVVGRFSFGELTGGDKRVVRGQLEWRAPDGRGCFGAWQEIAFEPADRAARVAEHADPGVLRIVGQHHADRARTLAVARSRHGDLDGARSLLRHVARRIGEYAGNDPELRQAMAELDKAERDLAQRGYEVASAKEAYFLSTAHARGQRDLRAQ
ncbi:MAG TPA: VWA domain-containing protein [Chloroflexota bacterium]|jgi:Mg-chelatase subunit ChlD|nr:VWA domain-containing protein [Chloroflexota bacterium]